MIAGGFDDFDEEGSLEFANIQAISNTETELAAGREPHEMFRSTTSTRARFIESQGCGVQVLMSAKTAIEIGASIYGIVAYTATITDKAGRSVPAPGCGVLSTAREAPGKVPAPSLDIELRKRQLAFRRMQISQLLEKEIDTYKSTVSKSGQPMPSDEIAERYSAIEKGAKRQEKEARSTFGMPTCDAPAVAPLRRALAVWEVNIDDIGVESFQGTSTKANDKEASELDNRQFRHLDLLLYYLQFGVYAGYPARWWSQSVQCTNQPKEEVENGIAAHHINITSWEALLRSTCPTLSQLHYENLVTPASAANPLNQPPLVSATRRRTKKIITQTTSYCS
ncbi:hypothetical protein KEM48_003677 [Puccinia striiformis f. sp. tritici PST-130]|nr:hypothetical protein KEM48_003677 [Puccinia striiformis f. sp. tritici PST-130]